MFVSISIGVSLDQGRLCLVPHRAYDSSSERELEALELRIARQWASSSAAAR
jgi:hypothetical protein